MAVLAVFCALQMLFTPNPVRKALWLVGTFISAGVVFLVLSAPLIFAVQLVVYAGAIMVLFLFVIMFFMNPEARRWLRPQLKGQLVFGGFAVLAFLLLLIFGRQPCGAVWQPATSAVPVMPAVPLIKFLRVGSIISDILSLNHISLSANLSLKAINHWWQTHPAQI